MTIPLYDMHVHMDFVDEPLLLAEELQRLEQGDRRFGGAFSTTVDPSEHETVRESLSGCPGVVVGLGLHPWWIADGRCDEGDLEIFCDRAQDVPFIGEIGLDLTERWFASVKKQERYLEAMLEACTATPMKLFSFHSAHAATKLLDHLEHHEIVGRHQVILHWFSGSFEELTRALRLGCYFSVNGRMLATKRGPEYVKVIPEDRLLLETDGPSERYGLQSPHALFDDLCATLTAIEEIRGEAMGEIIAQTSEKLLRLS